MKGRVQDHTAGKWIRAQSSCPCGLALDRPAVPCSSVGGIFRTAPGQFFFFSLSDLLEIELS